MDSSSSNNGPANELTDQVMFEHITNLFPTSRLQNSTSFPPPSTPPPRSSAKARSWGPNKTPVKWVDLFTCFLCQKQGRSPPLRRCSQCEIAYYCSKTCQRGHWKQHMAACIAALAAKADDARRERLAQAVREKGPLASLAPRFPL